MEENGLNDKAGEALKLLQEKYQRDGQDLSTYLTGLYHSSYLNYWDYINLDTLLTLQHPRTEFPDEMIFVAYHQISELYFKLILQEIDQIAEKTDITQDYLLKKLRRINLYFEQINASFDIIGLELSIEEFSQFRTSLFPASGFQSVQFRKIEICSTDMFNLVDSERKTSFVEEADIDELYEVIYWKKGATDRATGARTLTLTQFDQKYSNELIGLATKYKKRNIRKAYQKLAAKEQVSEDLIHELRKYDISVNVRWSMSHLKAAVKHLKSNPSTGGTNWKKYLPPHYQKTIFFPELWTDSEKEEWGKDWLEN